MDNQQRNDNLIYLGNIIKEKDSLLIIEKYKSGTSLMQLSNLYNYNIATIRYFLIKNKIEIRNIKESVKPFHKIKNINIDDFLHQNLIGWILGDGGLRKTKNSINAHFNYADLKETHIKYICSILDKYNIKYSISKNKDSKCFHIQSEALPQFNYYYELFYGYEGLNENGQKRKILPDITITPIILLNWFIGDGSSIKQNRSYNNRGQISCKYKNEFILQQFNELFENVKCYTNKSKTGIQYSYHFNNKSFKKLLKYIGKCPIEDYEYKWIVRRSTTIIEPSVKDEGIV